MDSHLDTWTQDAVPLAAIALGDTMSPAAGDVARRGVLEASLLPQGHETVFFFDWDDTLLCSSYLTSLGFELEMVVDSNPALGAALALLSQRVLDVLKMAQQFGKTYIVTNAEHGWVERSAQTFLPDVFTYLATTKLPVLSARSTYESKEPANPVFWKTAAFAQLLHPTFGRCFAVETAQQQPEPGSCNCGKAACPKTLVSFGDSYSERLAVIDSAKTICATWKSIKFIDRPSAVQLTRQLDLLIQCFQFLVDHPEPLDLMLTLATTSHLPAPVSKQLLEKSAQALTDAVEADRSRPPLGTLGNRPGSPILVGDDDIPAADARSWVSPPPRAQVHAA